MMHVHKLTNYAVMQLYTLYNIGLILRDKRLIVVKGAIDRGAVMQMSYGQMSYGQTNYGQTNYEQRKYEQRKYGALIEHPIAKAEAYLQHFTEASFAMLYNIND